MTIRQAEISDARSLSEIYAPYVEHTAVSFEYTAPTADEFADRISKTLKKFPYFVAEEDGVVVGYAYASAFHPRKAYERCAEASIYIKNGHHKKGIGRALYAETEKKLVEMGYLNLYACVAYIEKEDEYLTHDSIIFHEKCGFKRVGLFNKCGYKFGRWYDMAWYEKHIGDHCAEPASVKTISEV